MSIVAGALTSNREAVETFLGVVDQLGGTWTTPRAPGKWSPSQVTEHLSRTYDESAKLLSGKEAAFPRVPGLFRPILRGLFFNRVVQSGKFPKSRTFDGLNPATGPATPAEGRARLEAALAGFEQQATALAGSAGDATVASPSFGTVTLSDWVRFQEVHAHHHQKQLRW